jgi:hypothetical protein
MWKTLTALVAAAFVAGATTVAASSGAEARDGGAFVAGSIFGLTAGAILGGALAPRYYYGPHPVYAPAPGYVVYPGYAAVPAPGCYWARRPIYDAYGRLIRYSRPLLFCP